MKPLVSIIVPSYNQAAFLPEALDSVLAQSYQDWECIIVNDGSTDHSLSIARQYAAKDGRIIVLDQPNGGLSSARNAGIAMARGKYILPLDGDDIIAPFYISEAVAVLEKDEDIDLVYGRAEYFGAKTGEWSLPPYSYARLLAGNIIYCSCIYRASLLQDAQPYDERMKGGYEDWEFLIRTLNKDTKVWQIPKICFYYRIKESSMLVSMQQDLKKIDKTISYVLSKNFKKFSQTNGFAPTAGLWLRYRIKLLLYPVLKRARLIAR